ncbi:MAG: DnaJ C-terminal domain-containing protein [Alphaproteobacteria bacterium]|nr:DnaJ C-terminal domain-containing protein [Alphaproteobacteria bacterium]
MSDPYQILGVSKTASLGEIKSAYRKLAKKLHPDVNPGRKDIEQKFKEVTAAYDLLSDPDKRARFDRGEIDSHGHNRGFAGGPFGESEPFSGNFRNARSSYGHPGETPFSAFGGMEDILSEFMGMASGRYKNNGFQTEDAASVKGGDVSQKITVSFVEACLGGKKRVALANNKTLDISIPAGVEDGHKLRLKGQGRTGPGGIAGDAIVELQVAAHPFFTRKDRDIFLDFPVSLQEAVLGASVTVPTLDGHVSLKIPKGSNSGTALRLKGKGVAGTHPGDMFVKLKIVLPEPVPQDLTDLVEKWAKKNAYNPRKKSGLES